MSVLMFMIGVCGNHGASLIKDEPAKLVAGLSVSHYEQSPMAAAYVVLRGIPRRPSHRLAALCSLARVERPTVKRKFDHVDDDIIRIY